MLWGSVHAQGSPAQVPRTAVLEKISKVSGRRQVMKSPSSVRYENKK